MSEWQLIETAPTGKPVLCAVANGETYVLLKNRFGTFVHWPCSWDFQYQTYNTCGGSTHWMPLPDPPAKAVSCENPVTIEFDREKYEQYYGVRPRG